MKLGFVFECSPGGGDVQLFQHILKLIYPKIDLTKQFHYSALKEKKLLEKGCGKEVTRLKELGCEKIFIVWDLIPIWSEEGSPCRHEDKERVKASLAQNGHTEHDVTLLCIERELEAWLIADEQALKAYFIVKNDMKDEIMRVRNPDSHHDPKGLLKKYFKKYRGFKFEPMTHTGSMLKYYSDVRRMKRSVSFQRFYFKLTGNELS